MNLSRLPHHPALVIAVLALLLSAGCRRQSRTADDAPSLPVATVTLHTVGTSAHTTFEEVVGTVRPRLQASLEAKVSGRIAEMPVRVGQTVRTGDLVAALDVRETRARLDQAVALRQQAERDLERFASLLRQEAVTQAEFDAVEARHRVALASQTEAETLLDHARVVAPFDGVVTRRLADVGDMASPGRPLLTLEDPARMQLEADIPEALIHRIEPGQSLRVLIPALDRELTGTVDETAPAADPGSRTFRVKLDLPPAPDLLSGRFARLLVPVAETETPRVPAAAIVTRGQMEIAFVVTNGIARLRLVKTGRHLGDQLEVLSGLNPGETIVVQDPAGLRDGQPVRPGPTS